MQFNWYILFLAGAIPLITGMLWYNPKVLGNAWLQSMNKSSDDMKGGNMVLIFGLTYLFGLMLASALMSITIHQFGFMSVLSEEPGIKDATSEVGLYAKNFYETYGNRFRTFKHGSLHGVLTALFTALPIIGIISLFEKKGFKYIAIHVGYWALTLGLMGGVICQFL